MKKLLLCFVAAFLYMSGLCRAQESKPAKPPSETASQEKKQTLQRENTSNVVPAAAQENKPGVEAGHEAHLSPVAPRERLVIDEFDYSTVTTSVQAILGTQQNIGKGIRDMLNNRLEQQGKVVVVEQSKAEAVMKEQGLNAGNRATQGAGARIKGINGADALLMADIVTFGRDDKKRSGIGTWVSGIGALHSTKSQEKAVVAIIYRLIDPVTSEVIATGEVRGESVRKSTSLGAFGPVNGASAALDMTSSSFTQTLIGEATQDSVNKLADAVTAKVQTLPKGHDIEASIVNVSGDTVMLNAGADDGVSSGEVLEVFRVHPQVMDPSTKEAMTRTTEKVGELTVTNVNQKTAAGIYKGLETKTGDLVRRKK
jgi:curli biogenesis system outer membrane secretion channel CsgG